MITNQSYPLKSLILLICILIFNKAPFILLSYTIELIIAKKSELINR